MKQLIVLKDVALATGVTHESDLTAMTEGALAIFDANSAALKSVAAASAVKLTNDFFVSVKNAGGRIIDFLCNKDFTVAKSSYAAGANKVATLLIPTPVIGAEYTVTVVRKGRKFNERSNWSASVVADSTTAADVALGLKNALVALAGGHGVTVTVSSATLTFTGTDFDDFEVVNDFDGTYTVTTAYQHRENGTEEIKDLFRQCQGERGYQYMQGEGKEIYPGYLTDLAAINNTGYTVYTLRFANDRKVKTGGPVVYQVLHIAVPSQSATYHTAITGSLDKLFGLA